MREIMVSIIRFRDDNHAVTALEYAVLAGLISLGIAGIFTGWGDLLAEKLASAIG